MHARFCAGVSGNAHPYRDGRLGSGTLNCCCEHELQTLHDEALWATVLTLTRRCFVETLIRRCAGLDVHKASVVACVRLIDDNGELLSFTQSFGTTTGDLLKLNDWLMSYAVTLVGMESTGVYW